MSNDDVFSGLVGQAEVVEVLRAAAAGGPSTMTHSWLFTGPPGSGRSVAARAFAAALQCSDGGCGRCHECHTALTGAHADVEIVSPSDRAREIRDKVDDYLRAGTRLVWVVYPSTRSVAVYRADAETKGKPLQTTSKLGEPAALPGEGPFDVFVKPKGGIEVRVAHKLTVDPGRIGQWPQQVEDRAGREFDAGRTHILHGRVMGGRDGSMPVPLSAMYP